MRDKVVVFEQLYLLNFNRPFCPFLTSGPYRQAWSLWICHPRNQHGPY